MRRYCPALVYVARSQSQPGMARRRDGEPLTFQRLIIASNLGGQW